MDLPASLARDISPPPPSKRRRKSTTDSAHEIAVPRAAVLADVMPAIQQTLAALAAVEAGKAKIDNHLIYFKSQLAKVSKNTSPEIPRLSIDAFASLYESNLNAQGHHFVVHQHNHPIAGVHYDLRLQFSETSSMSFALPKGLPGDANSRSIGRMAIETRVHNYWNHLIESASSKTGSLLIWDTGTYSILPRKKRKNAVPSPQTTDDEDSDIEVTKQDSDTVGGEHQENSKLIAAFQTRYIRLRLHGTRLPRDYTIILRLPSNAIAKRPTAKRKSRKRSQATPGTRTPTTSDDETDPADTSVQEEAVDQDLDTDTEEDDKTRATNAYPGSTNDIGSIHQRHWLLQLDRQNSGFRLETSGNRKRRWTGGFEPFFVRGRDHERSVVTGRLAHEVESDEGVEDFVGRGGWVGIEH